MEENIRKAANVLAILAIIGLSFTLYQLFKKKTEPVEVEIVDGKIDESKEKVKEIKKHLDDVISAPNKEDAEIIDFWNNRRVK